MLCEFIGFRNNHTGGRCFVLGPWGLIWEYLQREQLLGAGPDQAVSQGIAVVTGSWGSEWGPGGPQSWAEGAWGAPGRKGLGQRVTQGLTGQGQGSYRGWTLSCGIPGRAVGQHKDQKHLCWQGSAAWGAGCGLSDES